MGTVQRSGPHLCQVPLSQNSEIAPENSILHPNVVLTVKVYRQRLKAAILPNGEVFQVLGTEPLTDLKDRIICVKDDAVAGDFSDFPHVSNEGLTPAKHTYKSGMFFIENTFYNDMREADNRDYSEPILKWAKENDHESYPHFRKAQMEDTVFLDLNIQLGVPYLYQHQGNCEHVIVFTDLRLLQCEDPQDISIYPFLLSETITRRIICRACMMDSAKWVVHESQLTPESPCFMCHSCFTLLHYDQNGQKICTFKA
ncbi:snRNA-activating protein complex subunit 3-like [Littorina saxatilis]|uniref:snRNA-activating protein complex subunit 3-like n=1 Tax=Littorina saxatilis TaxID=31220 RepID=UPI0038B531CA